MKPFTIDPRAVDDLAEAMEWYREHGDDLDLRLHADVRTTIDKICLYPEHGQRYLRSRYLYRKTSIFPYLVIYENRLQDIFVIAIAHERRKPRYWKRRT